MISGHNSRERALLSDIGLKNCLSNRVRRLARAIRRWEDRLARKRSHRWAARYANAVRRAALELEPLEADVLRRAEALRGRIEAEKKVSEGEIRQYQTQFKKEVGEMRAAQKVLENVRRALAELEVDIARKAVEAEKAGLLMVEANRKLRRAESKATSEAKDVKNVAKEIASEERDRRVMARELRRAMSETEALRR
ncbi:MAG TPA: hypothetical protein VI643_03615 [Planctomycetota bacterium]|nr:hypothetical protein [Planctomycetota bacterium]